MLFNINYNIYVLCMYVFKVVQIILVRVVAVTTKP